MLDRMPVRYIALDSSPIKAIEARGKGLPVFYGERDLFPFTSESTVLTLQPHHCPTLTLTHTQTISTGDINRPEVLHNFNVGEAKACVFTIDDMAATNKV